MDPNAMWSLQTDWYSPTRLLTSPVQYDFPDRYRQKLEENLTLDSEGRPFRMLVFRGSPKSRRKSLRLIDEMRRSEEEEAASNYTNKAEQYRCFPKSEARILDAPNLKDDYYLSVMDWGKTNLLAVALGPELYLWNAQTHNIQKLSQVDRGNDYPSSVAWSDDAKSLAVGHVHSEIQLWDAEALKLNFQVNGFVKLDSIFAQVRRLEGHEKRVGALAWNGHVLTSGSLDRAIINHDVRVRNSWISRVQRHTEEVCGLKWSGRSNVLASGGNDNLVYIWEASKMGSMPPQFLHRLSGHRGAVKALAWSPYDSDVLATGGGTEDGCIKLWNAQKGILINSVEVKAQASLKQVVSDTNNQICGLEWNRHHKEILSGHGFGTSEHKNELCLWRYPSMSKIGGLTNHSSRVLHLSQSPDGLTVASAGADETIRLWEIFGPARLDSTRVSELDGMLSLKTSPIR
ncbi:hypothetical protein U1Q18_022586 [Sarracenia purpurea var. burkii]